MRKHIRRNDTKPRIHATLYTVTEVNGVPQSSVVDLTDASVKFIMRQRGVATAKINTTASIIQPATGGQVEYAWDVVEGDTDTIGEYLAEFEVTDSGGDIMTFWDLRTATAIEREEPPEPLIIVIADELG